MPQVQSDPAFSSGVITNGGQDLFSYPNVAQPSFLELQTDPAQPLPPGTATATNLLIPDLHIDDWLKTFPSTVFDTSPTSLLYHFMQALLGAAGGGQVRKRQMISRLQQAVTSTHFYDLDSFYGALFGAARGPGGTLPSNPATGRPADPYNELASPDGWDEIEAVDAVYRERVIALARAITLGATVPGMQAIAEAITGVPCQVYETWRLITNPLAPAPGFNTWEQVMGTYPTWSSIPASKTWQEIEGVITFAGLMGNGALNEVVIRPRKAYTTSEEGLTERGSDTFGILSVAEVLQPAEALISVDTGASGIVTEIPIPSAWSDSEYCEIVHKVSPASLSDPDYGPSRNAYQGGGLPAGETFVQPRPPFCRSEGGQYSYVSDVSAVSGLAVTGDGPNHAVVTDGQDFQTVVFPHLNPGVIISVTVKYTPDQAIMSSFKAATARSSSPVAIHAAPYSGSRVPIQRAS